MLSQILWSPVRVKIIFILHLKLRLREVRKFVQDYPTSKGQWESSSNYIHLLLPFAQVFLHMILTSSTCLDIGTYCSPRQSKIEYCICRKDNLCASNPPHCKIGKLRGWGQATKGKEHNEVNTPKYQTFSKMCIDKYLQKPF